MAQTASTIKIRNAIKALLKKHGQSYKDLSEALGLSEGAVKQLMTKGSFTTDRIEKVAHWFGLSVLEFIEIALKAESKPHMLSHGQEEILLSYPISIWLLFLLGTGFSLESAKERMNLDAIKFQRAIHRLDQAKLIELLPQNRIRLKSRGPYRFNKTGAIEKTLRKDYLALITGQIQFNPPSDSFQKTFELYFSADLLEKLRQDLKALLGKYAHLTRIEAELDSKDKKFPVTGIFFLTPFDGWGTLLNMKK